MIAAALKRAAKLLKRTRDDSDFIQSVQVSWLDYMSGGGSEPAASTFTLGNAG
jgi:hypothetical protein